MSAVLFYWETFTAKQLSWRVSRKVKLLKIYAFLESYFSELSWIVSWKVKLLEISAFIFLLGNSAFLESQLSGKLSFPGEFLGKYNYWKFLLSFFYWETQLSWKASFLENSFPGEFPVKLNYWKFLLSWKASFLESSAFLES